MNNVPAPLGGCTTYSDSRAGHVSLKSICTTSMVNRTVMIFFLKEYSLPALGRLLGKLLTAERGALQEFGNIESPTLPRLKKLYSAVFNRCKPPAFPGVCLVHRGRVVA
jgi:hypothetical protein